MRMLHLFTGHELFLDAIRLFLKRYSYKTATAIDFWMCVEEITNLPISINLIFLYKYTNKIFSFLEKLIHSWCTNKSYPVVQVKMLEYDGKTGKKSNYQ